MTDGVLHGVQHVALPERVHAVPAAKAGNQPFNHIFEHGKIAACNWTEAVARLQGRGISAVEREPEQGHTVRGQVFDV